MIERPNYRRLKVPTNWSVRRTVFYNISPDAEDKLKINEQDDGWTIFEHELLTVFYKQEKFYLDLGWKPEFNPEGNYVLRLIEDNSWQTSKQICNTRSLQEVTNSINQKMLEISIENGDYPNYPQDLQLQEFIPDDAIRYVKNEFFDIEPSQGLSDEQWKLFQEEMLIVERYKDSDWQVTAGWFPAFDPNGQYRIKVSLEKLDKEMFEIFETKEKKEAVDYINEVFSVHLKKLYERYNKKVKADKERARQLRLQMQRNQKI